MGSVRYSFKNACKHFGIDPDEADAEELLINALREADSNKKKRGRKQVWTAKHHVDFVLDAMIAARGRVAEISKKEWAELICAHYPGEYDNPDRVRAMLSDGHLRPTLRTRKQRNNFARSFQLERSLEVCTLINWS